MLYTPSNARGATVHDVDTGERIDRVQKVDAKNGWIMVEHDPVRISPDGRHVIGYRIRFRSIYPIFAGQGAPVLFHCYGRLE